MTLFLSLFTTLIAGCQSQDKNVDPILSEDTASSETQELYTPTAAYDVAVSTFEEIDYTDVLGHQRELSIAVYRPKNNEQPWPVVLLSHGGSSGKTNPLKSLPQWAELVASKGYFAIAIAHPAREESTYVELCEHLQVPDSITCSLKLNWERPHDVVDGD